MRLPAGRQFRPWWHTRGYAGTKQSLQPIDMHPPHLPTPPCCTTADMAGLIWSCNAGCMSCDAPSGNERLSSSQLGLSPKSWLHLILACMHADWHIAASLTVVHKRLAGTVETCGYSLVGTTVLGLVGYPVADCSLCPSCKMRRGPSSMAVPPTWLLSQLSDPAGGFLLLSLSDVEQ